MYFYSVYYVHCTYLYGKVRVSKKKYVCEKGVKHLGGINVRHIISRRMTFDTFMIRRTIEDGLIRVMYGLGEKDRR